MDPELREALNQVVVDVRGETREALDRFAAELRGEIQTLGTELRGEIQTLGTDLRAEMQTQGTELRGEIESAVVEMCRHFDVVGDSLRGDIRAIAEGMVASREQTDRRIDEQAGRTDGLGRRVLRLEVRVTRLAADRKPPRPRRRR